MTTNWSEGLRLATDRWRGGSRSDSLKALRRALEDGQPPDWRELSRLALTGPEDADPPVVGEFLLAYTDGLQELRALDPWAGLGVSLLALAGAGRIASGLAVEIDSEVFATARVLSRGLPIEWQLGDASQVLMEKLGSFDLILGSPPLGLPPTRLQLDDLGVDVRTSKTYTMLIQAAAHLNPTGTLAAVLPEAYFHPRNAGVQQALAALSVFPSAALALPRRGFATSIQLSLVLFSHEPFDELFVAELDPEGDLHALVGNLRSRSAGALPQLGRLAPVRSFQSWLSVLRADEIVQLAADPGLGSISFADLLHEVHSPRKTGEPFAVNPSAVYLPKVGTSPAVRSLDELTIQPHNYLQLVARPEVADSDYLAAFLNSPLGRKVREQIAVGSTVPQITITSLRAATAYLPPSLERQREAVRIGRSLGDLQRSIASLERQLWDHPLSGAQIEARLRRLLQGDRFESWMDTLPFPLASILWRYHAQDQPETRCRSLVFFFEATAILLVDILLSGLRAQASLLAGAARLPNPQVTYARSSIGIWADLLSRLSSRTRSLFGQKEERALALELFRVSDVARLEAITDKRLTQAIKDEAASYRRDWIGHPGVVGAGEWERRLAQAEGTLSRLRDVLGDAFDGWDMVRTGVGRNHGGVISTRLEYITSSRSLFRSGEAELREWPEDRGLYMHEAGSTSILKLGPLLRLEHAPEAVQDACYFYSRLEPAGVRWVSFHYEPRSEFVQPDGEVAELIAALDALG